MASDHDVVEHAQVLKEFAVLEGAGNAKGGNDPGR
jgi:hypothetical protein